ncbi:MAG: acyl-CoA thioesterase [Gammaproteobacteria bacterium]
MDSPGAPDARFVDLAALLRVEPAGPQRWRSVEGEGNIVGNVSGGQLLGQACMAAAATVDADRRLCALHGSFVAAGKVAEPVEYAVERIRDGRNFCQRAVVASQSGRCLFRAELAFKAAEGGYEHQHVAAPDVPPPADLHCFADLRTRIPGPLPEPTARMLARPRPLDIRPVDPAALFGGRARQARVRAWMRSALPLPACGAVHDAGFAYASDFVLGAPVTVTHADYWMDGDHASASLNHAFWIHRPLRMDEWLLLDCDCPGISNGIAIGRGDYHTQAGVLAASVVQQMFIRRK